MKSPVLHRRPPSIVIVLVVLVTALAPAMRIHHAGDSLWLDELHTAWTVEDGVDKVATRAAQGNQGSVYFYLTWVVVQCGGLNEMALRMPSIVAGTLLVPLLFLVVLRWTSSNVAALLAASLAAIDRDFLFYGQEARPYAAVQLIGLVQVYAFSHLMRLPPEEGQPLAFQRTSRIVLICASLLLFHTHPTGALLFLGELACYLLLLVVVPRPSYGFSSFLADGFIVGLGCVPAGPYLSSLLERRDNWRLIAERWPTPALWRFVHIYLCVPALLLAAIAAGRWLSRREPKVARIDLRVVATTCCWLFVPLLCAWLGTYFEVASLTRMRYVIVALPASLVAAALCCAAVPNRMLRTIVAIVVLGAAIATSDVPSQYQRDGRFNGERNEDWRSVVEAVNQAKETRKWPVFVAAGLIEDDHLKTSPDPQFHEFCLFAVRGIYRIEATDRHLFALPTTDYSPTDLQLDEIRHAGGAWLIVRGTESRSNDYTKRIRHALNAKGWDCVTKVVHQQGAVQLARLELAAEGRH